MAAIELGHDHVTEADSWDGASSVESLAPARSPATMKRAASMASMMSIDEDEMSTEARQCLVALREGKRCAVYAE